MYPAIECCQHIIVIAIVLMYCPSIGLYVVTDNTRDVATFEVVQTVAGPR